MYFFFFFNDTATTEIYTLSLHDALPISSRCPCRLFPAAFMSRSTSRSVRYSRVRYSAFDSRPRGTVLFTVLGVLTLDLDFIGNFPCLVHDCSNNRLMLTALDLDLLAKAVVEG